MDFPIIDLIDEEQATAWLLKHFHPEGLHCPHCGAGVEEARLFGRTQKSHLQIYRCLSCDGVYNLYSGTVFQQKQLTPPQAVLLLRGVCQGVPSAKLAREIGLDRQKVMSLRRVLQSQSEAVQPSSALPDKRAETMRCSKMRVRKGIGIETLKTRPVGAAPNGEDTAPMPTTVHRWLAHLGVRVVMLDCVWFITRIKRR